MNESVTQTEQATSVQSPDKVDLQIQIDAELLEQIQLLTQDPSKVIDVAVRQWLIGSRRRDDDLTRTHRRNPPVPPRGEWND